MDTSSARFTSPGISRTTSKRRCWIYLVKVAVNTIALADSGGVLCQILFLEHTSTFSNYLVIQIRLKNYPVTYLLFEGFISMGDAAIRVIAVCTHSQSRPHRSTLSIHIAKGVFNYRAIVTGYGISYRRVPAPFVGHANAPRV